MADKVNEITWEYCECGCHGYELRLGTVYFWMLNDLGNGQPDRKPAFHLFKSHQGLMGGKIGTYKSFDEADAVARRLAKPVLEKDLAAIQRALASFQS